MGRIHAPEIEDEPWCPRLVRDGLTSFLRISAETMALYQPCTALLADVLRHSGHTHIVDLCSGGGGPLGSILAELPSTTTASLTDLYPNHGAFDDVERRFPGRVRGERNSIDATAVPEHLVGVRTMFNAFHHLRPEHAFAVLDDAARKRQPLCVFEVVERHPITLGVIAGVPLAVLATAPLVRPASLPRLLATFVVPALPLITLWDGLASCLRAYSPEELEALAARVDVPGYRFTVSQTKRKAPPGVPLRITALLGTPA